MAKPARQPFFGPGFAAALAASLLVCGCGGESSTVDAAGAQATDAGLADAGADAGPFVCGRETCDPSSQLCFEVRAGVRAAVEPGCQPFPEACAAAPSCDCILQNIVFDRFAFYCDLP